MATVVSITIKKQGVGAKGPWTMFEAVTSDGIKASGFDPVEVGDEVTIVQKGEYLNYTKVGEKRPAPAAGSVPFKQSGGGGQYQKPKSPEDQARIERQHSQEMAIRLFAIQQTKPTTKELRDLIDWFQRDIGHSPERKPEPEESYAEEPPPDSDEPPF